MKVIIINGQRRSGKDSVVLAAKEILGEDRVLNISTVDKVKRIATECGWNGEKTPEARLFLSELKRITTDFCDMAFKDVVDTIKGFKFDMEFYRWTSDDCIVFIHSREPEDIMKYVKYYQSEGEEVYTLLVRRSQVEDGNYSNTSDAGVLNFSYDTQIWNDGDLEDLKASTKHFLEYIGFDFLKNS